MNVDETLSKESRRQREGTGNTGAFGQRTGHSDLIFFEGILPEAGDEDLNERSLESQVATCLDRLESVLVDRNVTLDDLMKVEVHLTEPSAVETVDRVYESRFDDADLPPRTVLGVCSLPGGADIQFDIVAAAE